MSSHDHQILPASTLAPAQPVYILRGHAKPIHSLLFLNHNLWLVSGDADGYLIIWTLTTKRPVAVWQAHEGSILGIDTWDSDKLITHGRDDKLCVWSLVGLHNSQAGFSTVSPVEQLSNQRKQPWLLHALNVSTVSFCAFTALEVGNTQESSTDTQKLLVGVPGSKDSEIELYSLPSEKKVALIPAPTLSKGRAGMVMALCLCRAGHDQALHVACGYESGLACLYRQAVNAGKWELIYSAQPHSQPILSMDIAPSLNAFYSSGADAVVAKHPLYAAQGTIKEVQTKHAGQQGTCVRNDDRILATSGWDSRIRIYSAKSLKELAVLKWHKEGCYAVCFGKILPEEDRESQKTVAEMREARVKQTHWLAAGSKDGKISLWDIY